MRTCCLGETLGNMRGKAAAVAGEWTREANAVAWGHWHCCTGAWNRMTKADAGETVRDAR